MPKGTAFSLAVAVYSRRGSANRSGFAEMLAFHGYPAASVADELHGRQFAFTHMGVIDFRRAAERAILFVAAGTAEMPGFLGHRTAGFTGIRHIRSPLWGAVRTARGLFRGRPSYLPVMIRRCRRSHDYSDNNLPMNVNRPRRQTSLPVAPHPAVLALFDPPAILRHRIGSAGPHRAVRLDAGYEQSGPNKPGGLKD